MKDYGHCALQALKIYLDRGIFLLRSVEKGEVDNLVDLLRDRDASYHNFRVFDALAVQNDVDIGKSLFARTMFNKALEINQELDAKLLAINQSNRDELSKINRSLAFIKRSRFNNLGDSNFKLRT